MAIRKPAISVKEARRLALNRSGDAVALAQSEERDSRSGAKTPAPPGEALVESALGKSSGEQTRNEGLFQSPKVVASPSPRSAGVQEALPGQARRPRRDAPPASVATDLAGEGRRNAAQKKMQVFLSAPIPAHGVSPTYELLCQRHNSQKSLQMILRKALASYEKMLRDGSFVDVVEDYPLDATFESENLVQTSRMMPKELVAIARGHFDPLGFESARAFGRKLGTAALAAFFAREA